MLDYPALLAVSAVIREGSFERAASVLNVTPSAVSQRVRLLEERIGTVLVVRGQPCMPTEEGKRICRHVERVGMLERDLYKHIPTISEGASPAANITIPISTNSDSLATWFLDAATVFTKKSGYLLDISVEDQEHTADQLRRGEVFGAVTALQKPIPGCRSTPLGSIRYCATAGPGFMRRYFHEGVNESTLSRAPGIIFNKKDTLQHQWFRLATSRDIAFPSHWLPSTYGYIDATAGGMGWGMNPIALVKGHLKNGSLIELIPNMYVDVPLYWQVKRISSTLITDLSSAIVGAARSSLIWKDSRADSSLKTVENKPEAEGNKQNR